MRLRYQLAGVSPFLRGSIAPRGCPPVRLEGLREQLADVSRAGHCRLLRCIPRLFPAVGLPMGAAPCIPLAAVAPRAEGAKEKPSEAVASGGQDAGRGVPEA